jgi:hypothetical protein
MANTVRVIPRLKDKEIIEFFAKLEKNLSFTGVSFSCIGLDVSYDTLSHQAELAKIESCDGYIVYSANANFRA